MLLKIEKHILHQYTILSKKLGYGKMHNERRISPICSPHTPFWLRVMDYHKLEACINAHLLSHGLCGSETQVQDRLAARGKSAFQLVASPSGTQFYFQAQAMGRGQPFVTVDGDSCPLTSWGHSQPKKLPQFCVISLSPYPFRLPISTVLSL